MEFYFFHFWNLSGYRVYHLNVWVVFPLQVTEELEFDQIYMHRQLTVELISLNATGMLILFALTLTAVVSATANSEQHVLPLLAGINTGTFDMGIEILVQK